jgi:hypothetical protein
LNVNEWRNWLQQHRWRLIEWAMAAVAGALTVWVVTKAGNNWLFSESDGHQSAVMQRLTAAGSEDKTNPSAEGDGQKAQPPGKDEDASDGNSQIAQQIKQINDTPLFAPPKDTSFKGRLTGIIGDKAIFNGRELTGIGESFRGAEVLEIGPNWIRIEFKDEKRRLWTFGSGDGQERDGAGRDRDRPRQRSRPRRGSPSDKAAEAEAPERSRGGSGRREVSDEMRRRFRQLPPERRKKILERVPDEVAKRLQASE